MRQLLVMELGVAPNCLDAALFSNQRLFHNRNLGLATITIDAGRKMDKG